MSYLKFKSNPEPCIQYKLIDPTEIMEYDDVVFNKYVPHIEISVMGLVPKELMEETSHPDNIDAIDVMVGASNIINDKKPCL